MAEKKTNSGQSEVQQTVDRAEDLGFVGTKVDPIPNSAYSLESGPDSPTLAEQAQARKEAE